jgi:hypothetical protein
MTKLLDGAVFSIAVIAIVLATPGILYTAFWAVYTFWHFLGVM